MHPGVIIASGLAALFALAIVAVVVSQKASSSNVISSAFGGLGYVIGEAVSPVSGVTPTAPVTTGGSSQLVNSLGNYLTATG